MFGNINNSATEPYRVEAENRTFEGHSKNEVRKKINERFNELQLKYGENNVSYTLKRFTHDKDNQGNIIHCTATVVYIMKKHIDLRASRNTYKEHQNHDDEER